MDLKPSKADDSFTAGVNIAGFDFGCLTDGSQNVSDVYPPLQALGGPDGAGQMKHFVTNDNLNIFRLPVGWQYLTASTLGGTLNSANLAKYDQLVQACLATGASCIVDIHNYARWNGGIIGQGGPTNAQFVSLWTQLATKYKGSSKIIFGVMNEPHDVDINEWATTVQAVVTAIRGAGATTQISESRRPLYLQFEKSAFLMRCSPSPGKQLHFSRHVHQQWLRCRPGEGHESRRKHNQPRLRCP